MAWRRRVATVLAGVGLAGAVVLAMPGAAVADTWVPPFITGSTAGDLTTGAEAVAGGEEAAVAGGLCATGAGCIATIALGLYATKQWWLPVVESWFGVATTGTVSGTATYGPWTGYCNYNCSNLAETFGFNTPGANGSSVTVTLSCVDSTGAASPGSAHNFAHVYASNYGSDTDGYHLTGQYNVVGTLQCQAAGGVPESLDLSGAYTGNLWTNPNAPGAGTATHSKTVTITCMRADGSTYTTSATSQANGDALVPACLSGEHGTQLAVGPTPGGGTQTVTLPATPDYPNCDPTGPHVCTLALWVDGAPCTVGEAACIGWTGTILPTSPQRLDCKWGSYDVALANCYVLERAYEPGGVYAYGANTDGNPATAVNTDPSGSPTSTASPATPITGSGANPTPTPTPVQANNDNCLAGMWSWNPVDWVYTPVKCALIWAFVPPASATTDFGNTINGAITGSALYGWFHVLSGWVGTLTGGGTGCKGPGIEWVKANDTTIYPFDACSGEVATIAGITHDFAEGLIILRGTIACLNAIASGFGWSLGLMRQQQAYEQVLAAKAD